MNAGRAVRVVLADDHPMFRHGLKAAITIADEIDIVGEAEDGRQLLAIVDELGPDVVITDLTMPGLDGAAATSAILAAHPEVGVLVLTMHEDDPAVIAALRAGAQGYLLKGADRNQIVRAILAVAAGELVYDRTVGTRVSDFFSGRSHDRAATVFPELTDRERQILEFIAEGCGNHEIARRLTLSEKTVRNHVSATYVKLQVNDRAAAVAKARDAGLGHHNTGG